MGSEFILMKVLFTLFKTVFNLKKGSAIYEISYHTFKFLTNFLCSLLTYFCTLLKEKNNFEGAKVNNFVEQSKFRLGWFSSLFNTCLFIFMSSWLLSTSLPLPWQTELQLFNFVIMTDYLFLYHNTCVLRRIVIIFFFSFTWCTLQTYLYKLLPGA